MKLLFSFTNTSISSSTMGCLPVYTPRPVRQSKAAAAMCAHKARRFILWNYIILRSLAPFAQYQLEEEEPDFNQKCESFWLKTSNSLGYKVHSWHMLLFLHAWVHYAATKTRETQGTFGTASKNMLLVHSNCWDLQTSNSNKTSSPLRAPKACIQTLMRPEKISKRVM